MGHIDDDPETRPGSTAVTTVLWLLGLMWLVGCVVLLGGSFFTGLRVEGEPSDDDIYHQGMYLIALALVGVGLPAVAGLVAALTGARQDRHRAVRVRAGGVLPGHGGRCVGRA
ncbi:hypothetical protein GCM10023322_75260 [Rugosimonospora acidiphila]|uniref:Integral membrane protein n=1 Tax=Rugosimonospora acidiphila TaxID=556531 RepID=A0ABP9SQM5_9ACTN